MNERGKNIVLEVNGSKLLTGFYALGFEPDDVMKVLYQAIVILCKQQGVDPAVQLMQLTVAAGDDDE